MSETTEAFPTAAARPSRTPWLARPSIREAAWGFVFIGPWLIGLALFTLGPMAASLLMSLTNFDLVHPESVRFVGLDNYARLAGDPTVIGSFVATIKFALITIPLTMVASLWFALLLVHPIPDNPLYQPVYRQQVLVPIPFDQ